VAAKNLAQRFEESEECEAVILMGSLGRISLKTLPEYADLFSEGLSTWTDHVFKIVTVQFAFPP